MFAVRDSAEAPGPARSVVPEREHRPRRGQAAEHRLGAQVCVDVGEQRLEELLRLAQIVGAGERLSVYNRDFRRGVGYLGGELGTGGVLSAAGLEQPLLVACPRGELCWVADLTVFAAGACELGRLPVYDRPGPVTRPRRRDVREIPSTSRLSAVGEVSSRRRVTGERHAPGSGEVVGVEDDRERGRAVASR